MRLDPVICAPRRHGICTYDPGFTSTGSCESSITYIDGAKGVLLYRGYDIEELAGERDFYDVSHLVNLCPMCNLCSLNVARPTPS